MRLVFANPDNLENELVPPGGSLAHDRKRLTIKMSYDEGESWPISRVLEAGPAGYSDLAQATDGAILCAYECGMMTRMTDTAAIVVARFDLDWFQRQA
jgi:sialidase-1